MASAPLPVNVYIAGIPTSIDEEALKQHFIKYGQIASVRILKDASNPKLSRGVGFVNFVNHEDAVAAIRHTNGTKIDAPTTNRPQALQVKFAFAKTAAAAVADPTGYGPAKSGSKAAAGGRYHPFEGNSENNVYVCGFPKSWEKEQLTQAFQQYGKIFSARVLKDPTSGLGRGVGFVRYVNLDDAIKAIELMNGKTAEGGDQPLQVRFAKESKKADSPSDSVDPMSAAVYYPAEQFGFAPWGLDPSMMPQQFMAAPVAAGAPGPGAFPYGYPPVPVVPFQQPGFAFAPQAQVAVPAAFPAYGAEGEPAAAPYGAMAFPPFQAAAPAFGAAPPLLGPGSQPAGMPQYPFPQSGGRM